MAGRWRMVTVPGVFVIMLCLLWVQAPLQLAFQVSPPAMEDLVQQVHQSGESTIPDRRVGLYMAREIERIPEGVRFVVNPTGDRYGFAYCPGSVTRPHSDERYVRFHGDWYLYTWWF